MKRLHVLYDQRCSLCQNTRLWIAKQETFFDLCFIPFQSPEVDQLFPGLRHTKGLDLSEKLVAVGDDGAIYQGHHAWIMCLYALKEYRQWAQRLSHPALQPFARRLCDVVAKNRLSLSRFVKMPDHEMVKSLANLPDTKCGEGDACIL